MQFELTGGQEAGSRFIDALRLFAHATNIGDVPASTTHAQLPVADRLAAGVTPGSVRLSLGLEHPDDLLEDLGRALERAR